MINFARNKFKVFFEISLWLILISFIIVGGIIGYYSSNSEAFSITRDFAGYSYSNKSDSISVLFVIIGGFIGLLSGLIFIIINGGIIAIFLSIHENIEKLAYSIPDIGKPHVSKNFMPRKKCTGCNKYLDEDYKSCPQCGNKEFV